MFGGSMKVGDLVTLSAAGSKQEQNWIAKRTKFGMVLKIKQSTPSHKPLFMVDWFVPKDMQYLWGATRRQGHWRYEIKKLKKTIK
tara:strand:+ start:251 stop:505 length:255 start_codon:yes stop_codon:yes gene_type:complete